jgi:intracellular sulfur oxidation DsrE/DsrF family protein
MKKDKSTAPSRRKFIASLAAGATAGLYASPTTAFGGQSKAELVAIEEDADAWFAKVKGKHRVIFDATQPHEVFPFAWPRVFLLTNGATGTPETDCGVVVVLRHSAIGYAFDHKLWEAYPFGETFKASDPATKAPAKRNPFWQPKAGEYAFPGIGPVAIGINELQTSGVMFCVCNAAITLYSAVMADNMKKDVAEVRKEWMAGLLPGVQVVPSGVWAVGRAQEKGCGYCFAG